MSDRTDLFYALSTLSIHGYGAQLMKGDGASPVEGFEAVAGVRAITPGAMTTADILTTHLRSPNAHQEHRPGLRDSGAFSLRCVWLPHEQSQSNAGGGAGSFTGGGLVADWADRTTHNWKIVLYADGSPSIDWPFEGYVSQFQPGEIGPDNIIEATISVQPTQSYSTSLP